MKRTKISLALTLLAVCSPALAGDIDARSPAHVRAAPISAYNWTGGYWGLNAGYGWADPSAANETDVAPLIYNVIDAERIVKFNRAGFIGGAQLGYNQSFNNSWLVGLETDFDYANIGGDGSKSGVVGRNLPGFPGSISASSQLQWLGTTRGRLGILAAERFLIFASGGVAYGSVKTSGSINNNGFFDLLLNTPLCLAHTACYAGSASSVLVGWTAGGGIEYAATDAVSLKLEYLRIDLGSQTLALGPTVTTTGGGSVNLKFNDNAFNVVRAGFNVRY